MTPQEVKSIATAFSGAWGLLFNTPVYILRNTSEGKSDNVYGESKKKTYETFGPFNASIMYQPTLQLLNENGLFEPANAMITFVNLDIQSAVGDKGTKGYNDVSTQDIIVTPWVDGTTKRQRLSEFTYQTQFGGSFIFLNIGVVDVLPSA